MNAKRRGFACLAERVGAAVLLLAVLGCPRLEQDGEPTAEPTRQEWLLAERPADDLVRASDTPAELRARFGERNIREDTIWVGEGMFEMGTVLFPADTARRVDVQWDSDGRPTFVRISEDMGWAWRIHPDVGAGTTLTELEELNGRAFDLYGFGWDYGGTVAGWRSGLLEELWGQHVILRLRPTRRDPALVDRVLGEREFPSDHPAMRGLQPAVYEVLVRPR